jgi:hypothetical protein
MAKLALNSILGWSPEVWQLKIVPKENQSENASETECVSETAVLIPAVILLCRRGRAPGGSGWQESRHRFLQGNPMIPKCTPVFPRVEPSTGIAEFY